MGGHLDFIYMNPNIYSCLKYREVYTENKVIS